MQITQADHEAVTRAVAEAELKTSGEIVTVVARESDGYTDVPLHRRISDKRVGLPRTGRLLLGRRTT